MYFFPQLCFACNTYSNDIYSGSKNDLKKNLSAINNVKMLKLPKSEQAISVEQNLYNHVCVTAAFKC